MRRDLKPGRDSMRAMNGSYSFGGDFLADLSPTAWVGRPMLLLTMLPLTCLRGVRSAASGRERRDDYDRGTESEAAGICA
jgi:hypothetical protein